MSVIGIDYEKCNKCGICVKSCSRYFREDIEQDKIVFEDPQNECNLCGRCIALCPTDAILSEGLGDVLTFKETQDPSTLIQYETMHKFMSAKRSMRGYKSKKVPKTILEKVLNTMKYAPTAANIRNLECTIISDENVIKKLSESVIDVLIASTSPRYSERAKQAKEIGFDMIFYHAPHVMMLHSTKPYFPYDSTNATIALTYGMLSAQSLGLGTCWIGLAHGILATSKDLRENILGIKGRIWGVITIGYPTQKFFRVPSRPSLKIKGLDELE